MKEEQLKLVIKEIIQVLIEKEEKAKTRSEQVEYFMGVFDTSQEISEKVYEIMRKNNLEFCAACLDITECEDDITLCSSCQRKFDELHMDGDEE